MRIVEPGMLLLLGGFMSGSVHAQDTLAVVYGEVRDISTREPLTDVEVEAIDLKWGRRVSARILGNGRYELDFMEEADYLIEFDAKGYEAKRIRIELHGPTPEEWEGGFGMNVDMTLFRDTKGLDLDLDGMPMGICKYNKDSAVFEWDMDHSMRMRARVDGLLKQYQKRREVLDSL